MAGTLNPASTSFTLQQRTRTRRDGGVQIVDTYVGPTSGLDTFLASYTGSSAPIQHPSHSGSVLEEIRERYDDSRTAVFVELTYAPATAGYAYTPLRPVGSVVIEAEPVTEEIPMSTLSSGDAEYDASKDTISKPAIQVSVIETVRGYNWTEAELKSLATGKPTPQDYFAAGAALTTAAWAASGCRVREGDGVAEITRVWMFKPRLAP